MKKKLKIKFQPGDRKIKKRDKKNKMKQGSHKVINNSMVLCRWRLLVNY